MSPAPGSGRERVFGALSDFGTGRKRLLALIVFALLAASAWLGKDLVIKTSRYGLVSEDNAYQRRMIEFFERFGYPDAPVFVVQGGDEAKRRAVVDAITEDLEAKPLYAGRVFGRLGAESIAEVLLLQEPDALGQLRKRMGPDVDVAQAIEGGVPGLLRALEAQLLGGLDGDQAQADPADVDQGLRQIGRLATVFEARLTDGDVDAALDELIATDDDEARARPETLPVDSRGYLTTNDGESLLIVVFPEFEDDTLATYEPVVDELRAIRDANAMSEVTVLLTGTPVMTVEDQAAVTRGLFTSGLATAGGIFIVLLLAFRSIRGTIVALVPLGTGTGLSVGALMLAYGGLNVITSSFAAVLMGLGIDLSVHMLARFHEEMREGVEREVAIRRAVIGAGPGIVVGATTTALAFLTLLTADFTAYGEMGGIAAMGLGLMFLCAMTILPALLSTPKLSGSAKAPPPLPGLNAVLGAVRKAPKLFVLVGAVGMAAGGACLSIIEFNSNYFDFLPKHAESAKALEILEEDGAMTPIFAFVSAPDIESSREVAAKLRALDSVSSVQAVSDMLPPLSEEDRLAKLKKSFDGLRAPDFDALRNRKRSRDEIKSAITGVLDALDEVGFALEQGDRDTEALEATKKAYRSLRDTVDKLPEDGGSEIAEIEKLLASVLGRAWSTAAQVAERGAYAPEDVPALFARRHFARDGSGAVSLYVYPGRNVWDRENAKVFAEDLERVDPKAAGLAMNLHYHVSMVVSDFRDAALVAGVLVFFLLLLNLRRVSDATLALAPALMGWCWMLGAFALTGVTFNLANIVVLPLVLGIGVDAGAHVVHRVRQSAENRGGKAKLEDMFAGTGGAVLLSAVTTAVGFGGLMLSEHGGMYYLGVVMVIGVLCTLVASLFVLPAALILLGRAE